MQERNRHQSGKSSGPRRKATGAKKAHLVFGVHSALSRIERASDSIQLAQLDGSSKNKRLDEVLDMLSAANIRVEKSDRKQLDKLTDNGNHQGVVLTVTPQQMPHENDLEREVDKLDKPFILVLDQVTDPHNLGACIRTADGAGADLIIVPKDGACPMTETVHRVASGATDSVPVYYVTNLARTLRLLKDKGIWLVGLADSSNSVMGAKYPASIAFVMGAEGSGLRRLTAEQCDELVSIPMHGSVSSLNVSVATGVVLYNYQSTQG
ncbi:MAG: 23S rRNA (guanosine2251-2'-O)-methyltransferase [Saprospiraceae bacterium]